MVANDTQSQVERARQIDRMAYWMAPTVLRRAAELNAHIEGQLAIRAASALPFAKSLARLGFVSA